MMICTFLCAFALGAGQAQADLTRKISVDIPASRAKYSIPALGKAAGLTMEAASNLQDEVFLISAHDVSVADLMKRVADAESGTWLHQSGIYILTRDRAVTLGQQQKELAQRTKQVKDAIANLAASVSKDGAFDQAAADALAEATRKALDQFSPGQPPREPTSRPTHKQTPIVRAVSRLLSCVDPEKLAGMGLNQRIVFSTRPTSVQQSFSGDAEAAFTDLVTQQQMYSEAFNAGQPQDTNRTIYVNDLGTPTMGPGDPHQGLGLGLMAVERRFGNVFSVQILVSDTRLATITSGTSSFALRPTPLAATGAIAGEKPLKLDADAQEMAKALSIGSPGVSSGPGAQRTMAVSSVSGGGAQPGHGFSFSFVSNTPQSIKISPELRAKVLDPEKHDPLGFVPGQAVLALAQSEGKNIVALLPDPCFGPMTHEFASEVTPSQLLAALGSTDGIVAKQDGDWLEVSPEFPAAARAGKVDRAALGTLLRALDKNGEFSLDDLCGFAVAQDKVPGLNDIDGIYPRLVNTSAANSDFSPLATGSYSLYRFYGTLTSGQRQAVASGRQMAMSGLGPDQLALVSDMLYNSAQDPNVKTGNPRNGPPIRNQAVRAQSFAFGGDGNSTVPIMLGGPISAATERTIVVPNGVTGAGFLTGSVTSQPVAQAISSSTGANTFYDAGTLGFVRSNAMQKLDPEFGSSPYDEYRMAHRTSIELTFTFNPQVDMSRSLQDISIDADSQPGSYDSLPAAFRQQVDEAANQMRNTFQKVGPMGGNRTPPP
ncbi:MAG TPA: hypothetical protein VMI31_19280 [Fimbriimonadaceae bacterium]|nr:hypothetical protein [Fimbriimonadaceae bacterium]